VATNFQFKVVLPTASPPGTSISNTLGVRSKSYCAQATQRSCTVTVTVVEPSAEVTAIVLPQRLFLLELPLGVSKAGSQSFAYDPRQQVNWAQSVHGSNRLQDNATV